MPTIITRGAASAQGFGYAGNVAANYIEDVFSTYLYTGNGTDQAINNTIQLGPGATSPGWFSFLGGSRNPNGVSVAVDSSGNIYVCGSNDAGSTRGFQIVKYNNNGVIQWQRELRNTTLTDGYSIAVASGGNVYVCGASSISSNNAIVIAKYDSSGAIQWQRSLADGVGAQGRSIALDSSENVYISGYSNATSGLDNFQIAKYNSSGVIQWQRRLVGSGNEQGYGIAVDSSGNVYVCGESNASGTVDVQLAKYDTSGTIQWQRRLGTSGSSSSAYSIALDSSANVYIGGSFSANLLVAKYNTSGTIQWQRTLSGSSGINRARSIAVDSSANVYVCGDSTTTGNSNALIAKYNTSGTIQWQREFGSSNSESAEGIAVDNSGSIYITGDFIVGSNNYLMLAKLPEDGSGTGFYSINGVSYSYFPVSRTAATSTLTSATSTLTANTSSLTDAASSLTDAATSISLSIEPLLSGSGKGGLVWMKGRSGATDHALYDTARGATFDLASNTTAAQTTQSTGLTGFLANGFSIGSLAKINTNAATYASWTFRKQAKFFDVVTYTGNGANGSAYNIPHNLTVKPGFVIIKRTDSTGDWAALARVDANNTSLLNLNTTASGNANTWLRDRTTTTTFDVGTSSFVATNYNINGATYVAYLFAHDAGGFGASGSDNVISCGSYTGSTSTVNVNLGWEPQFVLIKSSSNASTNWMMFDVMRGMPVGGNDNWLQANTSSAENPTGATDYIGPTATGFSLTGGFNDTNNTGFTYIYIAIRRGPMKTPTSGTSVFGLNARTGTGANATVTGGQTDDAVLTKNRGSAVASLFSSRLTGTGYLVTSSTAAEVAAGTTILQANPWDVMDGVKVGTTSTITNASANTFINYLFRRAPGFFDEVCYTGTGSATTVSHNLGVAPELMIVKKRSAIDPWTVYYGNPTKSLELNSTAAAPGSDTISWNSTSPTSSVFTVGVSDDTNGSGFTFVNYLFATCPGVSKVGSYTGNGTSQTINCGFTGGARFILIKRTDSTGNWFVWDTARGIVAGNDPYWLLNSTAAEVTVLDVVDADSSGFIVNQEVNTNINVNAASYIFLAIA